MAALYFLFPPLRFYLFPLPSHYELGAMHLPNPFPDTMENAFMKFRSSSQWVYTTSGEPLWRKRKKKDKKKKKEMTIHCSFFAYAKLVIFWGFFPSVLRSWVWVWDTYCINAFLRTVLIRQTDVQQQLNLLNFTVTAIKSTVPPDRFSGSKVERVVQL